MDTNLLGISSALLSALIWGSGDFSGGLAARKLSPFQVLVLTSGIGILLLIILGLAWGEALPAWRDILWAVLAGFAGAFGIAALYRALSLGCAASAAPTSAVITAIVPVLFTALTVGLPGWEKLLGFGLALLGIYLVARSPAEGTDDSRKGILLALLAGLGFGTFFVLIAQVSPGRLFFPLVASRSASLSVALVMVLLGRQGLPDPKRNLLALFSGILDTGGNVFYLLATHYTRLDIAAVLSSLYPAATVLLSILILKERVSGWQWLGVASCLAAVALIAS
jgi:drug/metabolite transporter (DMT)-like permease